MVGMTAPLERLADQVPRFEDNRGWLQVLHEHGEVVLKRSFSKAGVFRGLHWQKAPARQTKIIRVVSGRILDFIVPMDDPARPILTQELQPSDGWVRIGGDLAHGFYAHEDTIFEYICEGAYRPELEVALSIMPYLTEEYGIHAPMVSLKDQAGLPLADWSE
ncbi:MAG: dTDP-4-dehydrorhamnose 3,5-epimerase family protein [Novosphingobium sp.]|nr:dTDP-4-dehydrorhamnose 3,5-epimerase family protein [Novosphingobium sp.]